MKDEAISIRKYINIATTCFDWLAELLDVTSVQGPRNMVTPSPQER
jgi:hypothetical protein